MSESDRTMDDVAADFALAAGLALDMARSADLETPWSAINTLSELELRSVLVGALFLIAGTIQSEQAAFGGSPARVFAEGAQRMTANGLDEDA